MLKLFYRVSHHMIHDNIFNISCFLTFSFAYSLDPVFRVIFLKFCQNSGFVKYQKEEVEKQKNVKNVIIHHMWDP